MAPAPPAASARTVAAGGRRAMSRAPLSAAAPASTGSATSRDSSAASRRPNPRARAAARVAPLRETPGTSASAWATPSASPSTRLGSARRAGKRSASTMAIAPATRPNATVGGVPSRVSIARSNASPASPGGAVAAISSGQRSGRRSKAITNAVPACSATSSSLRSAPGSEP